MPTQNMQLILQGILAVTNNTIQNAPQISTFDFQNPTLGANSLFFDPFFQAPTTSASVPLPATVCYCAIIGNVNDPKNHTRWIERLARILNRNTSFGATMHNTDQDINLDIWKATGTTPGTANTQFAITHSLGRVPITIVGQDTNNGGLLYRGSTAWTKTTIYLKCTTASAAYHVIVA